ncbi:MAG: hypothetical protein UX92_C0002G0021 [Candidatus Amesbacteria bacterium GW2011_GWA1_47_20]|uniref:Uncharacterized protein n=1 Tax=Candidatus Amesbacteria bacterium GW2011_GWA1_47_20 TaxID=1618354 RepID=A0A0G1SLE9_9BACT|nr:MAG: hypothetical protein UX92_C0002G0021 [Candidatus Amesbacteria bacterium GW2011_GWA1_47_20]
MFVDNGNPGVENYFHSCLTEAAAIIHIFVVNKYFLGKFAYLYDRTFGQEHTGARDSVDSNGLAARWGVFLSQAFLAEPVFGSGKTDPWGVPSGSRNLGPRTPTSE